MIPGHSIAMDVSKQHLRGAHGQKVDLGLFHKATICLQLREHTVSIEYGKAFLRADPCLSQGLATYLHSPMELTRSIERWHTRSGSNWSTISSRMNHGNQKAWDSKWHVQDRSSSTQTSCPEHARLSI